MKRIIGFISICYFLTSCTVMEPEQHVVSEPVEYKPLRPFKPKATAEQPRLPDTTGTRKIALLVPLSGQHKNLGESMLHAAELALFDQKQTSDTVLLPRDTHGSVEGAHQAAQQAMNEGADIILGPIFAKEVEAVKALAQSKNIPVLAFTTDKKVAGGGIYALGFLPSQQVEHVTRFASKNGHDKIVALTPKNDYGRILNETLQDMRQSGEINLVDILHYAPNQMYAGSPIVQQMVLKIQEAQNQGATAILFPEAGPSLSTLIVALQSNGLHNIKVLGTGQWDTPQINQTPGLQGAWFAAPDPQGRTRFENTYRQQFGQAPPRISTLAYDATALALALAPRGYDNSQLTSTQGYSGIDGLFRLQHDGKTERGLAVLEVANTGVRTLSPAPQTF